MSFSIVVNFKELLLFHVDVSLIWLNTLRKKKKSNSTFDVNCQKTSQVYSEFCASVWSFLKFISNNTQNSFSCQTENVHWHEIKVNAYKLAFLFFICHLDIIVSNSYLFRSFGHFKESLMSILPATYFENIIIYRFVFDSKAKRFYVLIDIWCQVSTK